jgi:hypothetical protein
LLFDVSFLLSWIIRGDVSSVSACPCGREFDDETEVNRHLWLFSYKNSLSKKLTIPIPLETAFAAPRQAEQVILLLWVFLQFVQGGFQDFITEKQVVLPHCSQLFM